MSSLARRGMLSTPITAIPSSLSTRSAPSIPPSSQLYEPLAKKILARRFSRNVLVVSAASAWAFAAFRTTSRLGGLEAIGPVGWLAKWVSPVTFTYAALLWSFGSVPIALLRKAYINATRSPSLSPQQTLALHVYQYQYRRALLVLLASSISLTICHSLMSKAMGMNELDDLRLGLWAGSKKHPYHINGRLLYLFLAQTSGAMLYWLRDVLKSRFDIRWTRHSNISNQALSFLTSSVASMALLSMVSLLVSLFFFAVLRMAVLPVLYRVPILHGLLRPLMAHFLRPKFTVSFLWSHFDLIVHAYSITLSTQLTWDITSTMFDIAFSLPVEVAGGPKDFGIVLVSGIKSTETYFQLHAFHELCLLSSTSGKAQATRSAIYADTKHNPTLWATIVRQCLLLLGRDYQTFLLRGHPPVAPRADPVAKASKDMEKPSMPVIHSQVYKTIQTSPINELADTLSSDGPITKALTRTSYNSIGYSELVGAGSRLWAAPKERLDKITSDPSVSSGFRVVLYKLLAPLGRYNIVDWWVRERKDKAAQKALPNRDLDSMIVEVLSALVSYSLSEDALGHVQRDIPRVLEVMVLYLSAIEEYQQELSASLSATVRTDESKLTPAETRRYVALKTEVALAEEWIDVLKTALISGIALIVNTFGDRLTSFKFPHKVASRLQSFVDYGA
ncbi:hypothetical protein M0805_008538 [Coniferiporia weirii]|nr:hypothetical protein M0805_008538 [Coniferiporia weirii]